MEAKAGLVVLRDATVFKRSTSHFATRAARRNPVRGFRPARFGRSVAGRATLTCEQEAGITQSRVNVQQGRQSSHEAHFAGENIGGPAGIVLRHRNPVDNEFGRLVPHPTIVAALYIRLFSQRIK